ncbi:CBN-EGL-1 protein [Caenorhabditis brenneri]|uniref:CBN-EGL-1 protein n=1 Tax=Caenorhabditis brenneri TaxID=135651 RepID=G0NM76_CAEBE|nr:CBN-EGL-1 protein [Caenorhabditis brenneri]
MLTFASTSSDLLLPMPPSTSHFDNIVTIKPFFDKNMMLYSEFSSAQDFDGMTTTTSSDFADDSGFFDDSETSNISDIGYKIGTQLAAMCDDFDAEMMSYSSRCRSKSLLDRILDFFIF